MATTQSPYPAFPSATTYPPHPYGCYYPPPIPYPNQPPPPSPSYHAAAYHHHHRFQLPPPSHPNPHWHQGVQQMQPGAGRPHHAAAQPPPPSSPPPRRPPPSSPPPLAASMAAVAPAWPRRRHPPSTAASPSGRPLCRDPRARHTELAGLRSELLPPTSPSSRPPLWSSSSALKLLGSPTPPSASSVSHPEHSAATRPAPLLHLHHQGDAEEAALLAAAQLQAEQEAENGAQEVFDQRPVPRYTRQNQEHLVREIVHIQKRRQHQEHSLESIQGEVTNLSNTVAQIAISLGMQHIQDGSIHSQASGFAFQQDVQFSEMPICVVNDEETDGSLSKNEIPYPPPPMSARATDQMQFQTFERMPVFDVYDDEMDGCSTEFVDVLAGIHGQQTCKEAQQESKQPTKCPGKTRFSPERPTVGAFSDHAANSISPHVPDQFVDKSVEYSHSNNEIELPSVTNSELCSELGKAQVHNHQWDMLLTEREVWDPGASTPPYSSKFGACVQQLRDPSRNVLLVVPERRKEWDPGDTQLHALFTTTAGPMKLQCTYTYKSAMLQILVVVFGVSQAPIFKYTPMRSGAFGLGCTTLNASALLSLFVPCSIGKSCSLPPFENWAKLQWNPGIEISSHMYIWLHMRTVKTSTWLQTQLFSDWHYELQLRKAFKQFICYSSIFSSTAMYMSGATNVCIRLVMSSGKLTQAEKDAADMYQVFKTQLPMRKTTHIWDPGIDSLLFVYIWLHLHMFQLVYYSASCACHLVSALLPLTQVTAKGSSNIEIAVLTSRYMISHLHQTTNWISTTSNGITSFEYGYTMDCLSGQWEFLHQQGFQNNYNATNLLSSLDYLQLSGMDIIFTTFLPP